MTPELVSSVLFVKNIEHSKKFYCDVLHQEIKFDFVKNIMFKSGLAIWEISPGHHITRPYKNTSKSVVPRFEIYFEVENIEDITDKIKSNDIKFLHEIIEESWGQRTIRFFDPDDHLIEIGEKMDVFVTRIYKKAGSVEKTSVLTGIPVNVLKNIIKK